VVLGYNAALLTRRLGAQNVFSIDLRPELVHTARERLARMGCRPFLKAADGSQGLPEHAPYDRIIATCSVSAIPPAWIEQTEPGGMILVDVEGQLSAGNLVTLRRDEAPVVHGKFLDWYGRFMALRYDVTNVGYHWPQLDRSTGGERTTTVDPSELDGEFRFLAQFRLPPNTLHTLSVENDQPTATCLTNLDGSWCSVDRNPESPSRYRVREDRPQELWSQVEEAHSEWLGIGRPAWHHFGLTATLTTQQIWLHNPDSEHTWELPR
jgi:Protein-L-isoaspartate(D-aspartate) O-methyltransferase (PCMT)